MQNHIKHKVQCVVKSFKQKRGEVKRNAANNTIYNAADE